MHEYAYIIAGTETEYQSEAEPSKDTPYLALTGELWVSFVKILEAIDRVITEPHCSINWYLKVVITDHRLIHLQPTCQTITLHTKIACI